MQNQKILNNEIIPEKLSREVRKQAKYDLEDRTLAFAGKVREFIKILPRSTANLEDTRQLIRSSGSVGANYIEANESLSKKDFVLRIKICKKEAKESRYWLRLLEMDGRSEVTRFREDLIDEVTQLTRIFASILTKCE
ncbi:MAG: four helix bundle protein [Candidatus Omnitrophica bacterium]|nr:four helix bundle protein [Candidatus Omnitrophota bacterium]